MISEKNLSASCVGALVLIAGLGLLSDRIQQGAIASSQGMASVINESGRQRMLTQLISNLATQYWLGDVSAKGELETGMKTMAAGHKELSDPYRSEGAAGSESSALHRLYFGGPGAVDAQVGKYLEEAQQVADAAPKDAAAEGVLHDLQGLARGSLRDGLNEIVLLRQRELEAKIATLRQLVWSLYVLMLGVLVLLWFLVFRPMARQIGELEIVEG